MDVVETTAPRFNFCVRQNVGSVTKRHQAEKRHSWSPACIGRSLNN